MNNWIIIYKQLASSSQIMGLQQWQVAVYILQQVAFEGLSDTVCYTTWQC